MTSVLLECSVWILIHWHVLSMRFIIVWALSFLSRSVIPFIVSLSIQYPPFGLREACFWSARAPTVSRLGFGFVRNSYSLYWIFGLLKRYSRSSRSGGSTMLSLKDVRRTPKHIRKPFGSSRHKNSHISFYKVLGDFCAPEFNWFRSLNISFTSGVSFMKLCALWSVSSCSLRHSISQNLIGNRPNWFQIDKITHT